MKKIVCLAFSALLLNACTPAAEEVMPPLQYNQSVKTHTHKKASLYWQVGEQHASIAAQHIGGGGDIASALIASAIDAQMRKSNPGQYSFAYGKAQQAVFMTSLKEVLQENHVFKTVNLITDKKQTQPDDVLMTIHFKSTRVSGEEKNHQIMLDVTLAIQSGQSTFERTYLVESSNEGFFSSRSFKDQQTDVSQQLLTKIMGGIQQWNKQATTGAAT